MVANAATTSPNKSEHNGMDTRSRANSEDIVVRRLQDQSYARVIKNVEEGSRGGLVKE